MVLVARACWFVVLVLFVVKQACFTVKKRNFDSTTVDQACGCVVCRHDLLPVYVQLLQDEEAEVRVAACQALAGVCSHLEPQQLLETVLPQVCYRSE